MTTHENAPPPPGWKPDPRPWCAARSGSCGAVCETRQHCIWLQGGDAEAHMLPIGENVILGEE